MGVPDLSAFKEMMRSGREADKLLAMGFVKLNGHFDYGNGYHGATYLNPHEVIHQAAKLFSLVQSLHDILPLEIVESLTAVAGPPLGGHHIAFTLAGLLSSSRDIKKPAVDYVPIERSVDGKFFIRPFYLQFVKNGKILLTDDVVNTGATQDECCKLIQIEGGEVVATATLLDRQQRLKPSQIRHTPLASIAIEEENYAEDNCPYCALGKQVRRF